jgi:hypothetical protein
MKVYLYNTDTGAYLGEDYSSEKTALVVEGETTIAPPPYEQGEVAIFDQTSCEWRVLSVERFQAVFTIRG